MPAHLKKWLLNFVKVAIAVMGLWIVVWAPWQDQPSLVWHDRVKLKPGTTLPPGESMHAVTFLDSIPLWLIRKPEATGTGAYTAPARRLWTIAPVTFSDRPIHVHIDGHDQWLAITDPQLYGVFAPPDNGATPAPPPRDFFLLRWVRSFGTPPAQLDLPEDDLLRTPENQIAEQVGLRTLLRDANPKYLLASWALLVTPFLVTAWRVARLMQPQGIRLTFGKCLALTFVGQFYSSFLPGITSGDLVKIIYTARIVGSKTKATITILLDRVIGLVALMVIGGGAAALQAQGNVTMRNVALMIGGILACLLLGAVAYFSHRLRRLTGLEWLLRRPFVPEFVRHADEVLHVYRNHKGILLEAFLVSLITQIVVPLSAWLAGLAFGIQGHPGYYLAYVPVAILAASLPISPPQGLGVLDSVLLHFFTNRGVATASQSFALAQAVRFLPLLWNLVGAYWVVTGTYSRHQALAEDAAGNPAPVPTP